MAISKEHQIYITDCFAQYDGVTTKRMFGGLGIFKEGVMFALLLSDGQFRMKADEECVADFIAEGSQEWIYQRGDGKEIHMGYWSISEDVLEDSHELHEWSDKAFDAAKRADAKKPKLKRKWIGAQ
jgi:DNA transformation protein